MQTTSVKLYSLEYSEAKTYLATALFLAGNIVLPQLFHTIRLGGPTWLPIYFFTLVGAYKYGWRAGLLTALASPVANALLFGMPGRGGTARDRTQIGAAGRRRRLCRRTLPPCVARTAGSRRTLLPGGRHIGRMGPHGFVPRRRAGLPHRLPGMLLQIFGGWAFINFIIRK